MTCDCDFDYDYRGSCVDAWELDRYYNCFESPKPVTDCELLNIGDSVEFNVEQERMWGIITNMCEDCSICCDFVVEVTSDLLLDHPFSKGDKLLLNIKCIYNHIIADENQVEIDSSPCSNPYTIPYD